MSLAEQLPPLPPESRLIHFSAGVKSRKAAFSDGTRHLERSGPTRTESGAV